MVIEQQITGAIITGIKELYGADVAANQVQLQKTKKEFKGHLTLVVFPFLRMSKKSPEQTAQEIGEYLLRHEPAVAEFNVIKGFLNLTLACACWIDLLNEINGQPSIRDHPCNGTVSAGHDRIFFSQHQQAAPSWTRA